MGNLASGSIDLNSLVVAGETASKYITEINDGGIFVHDSDSTYNKIQLTSSGMEVFMGNDEAEPSDSISVAKFGTEVRVGDENKKHLEIDSSQLNLFDETQTSIFKVSTNENYTDTTIVIDGPMITAPNIRIGASGAGTVYSKAIKILGKNDTNIVIKTISYYNRGRITFRFFNSYLSINSIKSHSGNIDNVTLNNTANYDELLFNWVNFNDSLVVGTIGTTSSIITTAVDLNCTWNQTPTIMHIQEWYHYDADTQMLFRYITIDWDLSDTIVVAGSIVAASDKINYTASVPSPSFRFGSTDLVSENIGIYSSSLGEHLNVGYANQTAIGKYNDNKSGNLFEIGNGDSSTPSNALEVSSSGNVVAAGTITDGSGNVLSDKAPIDNPAFTTRVTSPIFRVTGHTTAIGSVLSASNASQVSLSATTAKTAASVTVPVGIWVVICTVNLPAPSADQYIRMAFNTTNNSSSNEATYHYTSKSLVKPQLVKIVNATAEATYYFSLYCSVAANVAAGNATISAVRII